MNLYRELVWGALTRRSTCNVSNHNGLVVPCATLLQKTVTMGNPITYSHFLGGAMLLDGGGARSPQQEIRTIQNLKTGRHASRVSRLVGGQSTSAGGFRGAITMNDDRAGPEGMFHPNPKI